jgi:hypothetical protein
MSKQSVNDKQTLPNRIFARLRMPQMMKAGVWLSLTGILVITALTALRL